MIRIFMFLLNKILFFVQSIVNVKKSLILIEAQWNIVESSIICIKHTLDLVLNLRGLFYVKSMFLQLCVKKIYGKMY
jgi:hypothetical protein